MPTEKHPSNPDYNLFRIIESADKEMIHSAMVKFFLETFWNETMLECFQLSSLKDKNPKIILENGDDYISEGKKIKIRFDIVGMYGTENRPVFVIENKFKAVPTVAQLHTYDEGLEKLWEKKTDTSKQKIVKVLMVFSALQISETLKQYLKKKDWRVVSYLSYAGQDNEIKSFLGTLKELSKSQLPAHDGLKYIFESYINRLNEYDVLISDIINKDIYLKYNSKEGKLSFQNEILKTNGLAPRFIYLQYLLSVQKEIDKVMNPTPNSGVIGEYTLTNNGGSQVIPSIAFWFNVTDDSLSRFPALYFSIDGMTAKIGFCYARTKGEEIKNELINDVIKFLEDQLQKIDSSEKYFNSKVSESKNKKPFKPALDKGQSGHPVYAPLCFPLEGVELRKEVIDGAIQIIKTLFSNDNLGEFHKKFNK